MSGAMESAAVGSAGAKNEKTVQVAIVGMGTVGTGVAKVLKEHPNRIARRAGRRIELKHAVVRDLRKERGIELPVGTLGADLQRVIDDPEVDARLAATVPLNVPPAPPRSTARAGLEPAAVLRSHTNSLGVGGVGVVEQTAPARG